MVTKKILDNGETRWVVRFYEEGRGSKRIFKSFERKVDAENFLNKTKEDLRNKQLNPFGHITFKDRIFEDEANNLALQQNRGN